MRPAMKALIAAARSGGGEDLPHVMEVRAQRPALKGVARSGRDAYGITIVKATSLA
jgi:hypothetical protein